MDGDGTVKWTLRPEYRTAVVDIGSNSIRLVVYSGTRRNPAIIYNEKVMAGLGSQLSETGMIAQESMERGMAALARFKSLIAEMQADEIICVATAAVRDASNGHEFADKARDMGFDIRILSGEQEAQAAGMGVISAIPNASGIVGDLGGGSLELARVHGGKVVQRTSMPLGVLRVPALRKRGKLDSHVLSMLDELGWSLEKSRERFYLVGGSWRAMAKFDMHLQSYPLRVLHHYSFDRPHMRELIEQTIAMEMPDLLANDGVPNSRAPTLPDAARLLQIVDGYIKPCEYTVSAYGLREGLLYLNMAPDVRARDPLLEPAARFGRSQSRYGTTGKALYKWLLPIFDVGGDDYERLLKASCHLADVGWQANPDFRAERGVEMALHGNWVGIDGRGRMIMAQTLATSFSGMTDIFMPKQQLASEDDMRQAIHWGLAIRLGKRLTGGTDAFLSRCTLRREDGILKMIMAGEDSHFYGEIVARRHQKLARIMGLDAAFIIRG